MKKLSFVVLAYAPKESEYLRLHIQNILNLELDIDYEIIFVDNCNTPELREMVRKLYPDVRIVENGSNIGHPSGNNTGLKAAEGEYIAMVNPDIIMRSSEDIYNMLQHMDHNNDIAFLGPKQRNPNGTVQYSCYRKYSKFTPIYRRTFIGKFPFAKKDVDRHLMKDFDHNSTIDVEWLLGSFMLIRNKAMKEIGVMNGDFFLYFGDYEWCDRAWAAGWRVVYFHETQHVYHYHQRESAARRFSVSQVLSHTTRIHIKDWITYLKISKNT